MHSRKLVHQVLILVRPAQILDDGSKLKAGILGEPYYYSAFGSSILFSAKAAHGQCYAACKIHLKDLNTLKQRTEYFRKAIEYCDSILRELDLCIFEYGKNNKKKRNSFMYVAKLTDNFRTSILDRINKDNLIYQQNYQGK